MNSEDNIKVGQEVEVISDYYKFVDNHFKPEERLGSNFFPATVIDVTWHDCEDRDRRGQYAVATLHSVRLNKIHHIGVGWLKSVFNNEPIKKNSKIYNLAYNHKSPRIRKKNLKRLEKMQPAA